ncbi:MAG TPA: bifunctional 4-hydroxy-2-oxoglutarate aldolase/2-dehydro-3-deoxy-phosphogluconate aldolase [Armatimonadota bacterium]|nr:bifunctional 4-hydroxy-2-oxoglutarate aldolase/2-dehydro-3-deoxy-phosphogluconate aldolase [Armatimonadota bacterium]
MSRDDLTIKEAVIHQTKATGVLPCIKLKEKQDCLAIAKAMYDGGARVIEITMTTPGALEAIEAVSSEFKGRMWVAAGTVLDAQTAREVILHGGSLIVNPAVIPEVIQMANRYSIPVYSGAFTATEVLTAMEAGASMVKIFPAQLGGPKYMTNLKMVFPQVNLIPSGGISLENAAEYIRCGACAVSGARTFMDTEKVREEGIQWITGQVSRFIQAVLEAKQSLPELP